MLDTGRAVFITKLNGIAAAQAMATARGIIDDLSATNAYADSLQVANGYGKTEIVANTILFESTNLGGSSLIFGTMLPSLFWMNNRGSSLFMTAGVIALCDKTWFRGVKYWCVAIPINVFSSFPGFDDRAESLF